jgi:hypothetical protein
MLLQAELPKRPEIVNEAKLVSKVDEAAALAALRESRGWKMLYKNFIEPKISLDRLLQARGPFRRAEETGAVQELVRLLKYIDGLIEEGQEANMKLEALRKK